MYGYVQDMIGVIPIFSYHQLTRELLALSRSEARAQALSVVLAQVNQAARASSSSLSCRHLSLPLFRFVEPGSFLSPARHSRKSHLGSTIRPCESQRVLTHVGWSHPPCRDLAPDPGPIFDRAALRAPAQSLIHANILYFFPAPSGPSPHVA